MTESISRQVPANVFAFSEWQQRVGIEREYKWSFEPDEAQRLLAGRTVQETLARFALPAGFRPRTPYFHRQETIYLDDEWRLLDHESSIAVIVNQGETGEQTYLKCKQTIAWSGLRRDAVELAEKIDVTDLAEATSTRPVLPVQYLNRQYDGPLALQPFATTVQQRWKLNLFSDHGAPLVVCWDECEIESVADGRLATAHCVEVETNMLDEESVEDLARLADAVSEFVSAPPDKLSKSRRAARLCGR